MPGGGINIENILKFKAGGFTEIHASATSIKQLLITPKVSMNSLKSIGENSSVVSDFETIKSLIKKINWIRVGSLKTLPKQTDQRPRFLEPNIPIWCPHIRELVNYKATIYG